MKQSLKKISQILIFSSKMLTTFNNYIIWFDLIWLICLKSYALFFCHKSKDYWHNQVQSSTGVSWFLLINLESFMLRLKLLVVMDKKSVSIFTLLLLGLLYCYCIKYFFFNLRFYKIKNYKIHMKNKETRGKINSTIKS